MRALFSSATSSAGSSMKRCAKAYRKKPAGSPRTCASRFERVEGEAASGCRWRCWRRRLRRCRKKLRARAGRPGWWSRLERPINRKFRCRKPAPISAASPTFTNRKDSRGATIWRLPRTTPSIARCRANTRISFTIRRPANIVCSTIAGTRAATRPRTTAGYGSFATAWGKRCIATRGGRGCCLGMRFIWERLW